MNGCGCGCKGTSAELNSLPKIVKSYRECNFPCLEAELAYFVKARTLEEAVERAVMSRGSNGKKLSHQSSINDTQLSEAKTVLLNNLPMLTKCSSFDEIHELVRSLCEPIYRVGELCYYDFSLRIGAKQDLFPEKVYIHRGVISGAKALLKRIVKEPFLLPSDLPAPLRKLPAHHIENLLCIYTKQLGELD